MNRLILCFMLFVSSVAVKAQAVPAMKIATEKEVYFQGDSIKWQCSLNGFGRRFNTVTLQLWIENLDNGSKWQYRFPIINGYAEGAITVDKSIPAGQYAFNYILQGDFFNIKGHLIMPKSRDSVLNYLTIFKDKESIINTVPVSPAGDFVIRGLVFQDTAMFSFSKQLKKDDPPFINIETSLDSTVIPVVPVITKFIHVVDPAGSNEGAAKTVVSKNDYHFDLNAPKGHELETVVIQDRKVNKQLKDYEAAYVSSAFKSIDEITLDGLSNDDMARSGDIYLYLTMHVPGLTTNMDPETGTREMKWRGGTPAIYLDEFKMPEGTSITLLPTDIAMVKVYRPGSGPLTGGTGNSGAIAIYTKTGQFQNGKSDSQQGNRFYIKGYSARSFLWSY